jgi:hypothetical protein
LKGNLNIKGKLRRLEKMSDDALRPIAPQILHLLRDLGRIVGGDAQRETLQSNHW